MDFILLMMRDGGPVMVWLALAVPAALVVALALAVRTVRRTTMPVVAWTAFPLMMVCLGLAGTWHWLVLGEEELALVPNPWVSLALAREVAAASLYTSIWGFKLAALLLVGSAWLLATAGLLRAGAEVRKTPTHAVAPATAAFLAAVAGFALDGLFTATVALAAGSALAFSALRTAPEGEDAARLAAGRVAVCWLAVLALISWAMGRSLTLEALMHGAHSQQAIDDSVLVELPAIDPGGALAAACVLLLGGLAAGAPTVRHLGGRRLAAGVAVLVLLPVLLLEMAVERKKLGYERHFTEWGEQQVQVLIEAGVDLPISRIFREAHWAAPTLHVEGPAVRVDGEQAAYLEQPRGVVEVMAKHAEELDRSQASWRLVADRSRTLDELRPLLRALRDEGKRDLMLATVHDTSGRLSDLRLDLVPGGLALRVERPVVVRGGPGAWAVAGAGEAVELGRLPEVIAAGRFGTELHLWLDGAVTVGELVSLVDGLADHSPVLLLDPPSTWLPPIDPAVPRPDDCVLSIDDMQPLLEPSQPKATNPRVERGPHGLAETVWLPDGTEVRLVQSGCTGFSLEWQVAPAPTGSPLEAARAVFDQVELGPAGAGYALGEASPDGMGYRCGDGWCAIRSSRGVLEIFYHGP